MRKIFITVCLVTIGLTAFVSGCKKKVFILDSNTSTGTGGGSGSGGGSGGGSTCAFNTANMVGKWKLTAYTTAVNNFPAVDIFNSIAYSACLRDDIYNFKINDTLTIDDAATQCVPSTSGNAQDGWKIVNNNTAISIDADTFALVTFTCTSLKIKQTTVVGPSTSVDTYTYTKQ